MDGVPMGVPTSLCLLRRPSTLGNALKLMTSLELPKRFLLLNISPNDPMLPSFTTARSLRRPVTLEDSDCIRFALKAFQTLQALPPSKY